MSKIGTKVSVESLIEWGKGQGRHDLNEAI